MPLRPLSTNVDKQERYVGDVDAELVDAFGGFPTIKDVLLCRDVFGKRDPVEMIVKITHAIRKMIFGTPFKGLTNPAIGPEYAQKAPEVAKVVNIHHGKVVEQQNLQENEIFSLEYTLRRGILDPTSAKVH